MTIRWTRKHPPCFISLMAKEPVSMIRPDLLGHAPAGNLTLNDKIKELLSSGKTVYHLAFGQSPFPVMEQDCI